MNITFIGHRDIYSDCAQLDRVLERVLEIDQSLFFYTGGMGRFDSMAATSVRLLQKRNSSANIQLYLVLPYMSNRLNVEKKYYESMYDEIILPAELTNVHYKAAIPLRNRWMVNQSDFIIAYVNRRFGGAYATYQYAQKLGKPIINLADPSVNENFTCIFPPTAL